MVMMRFIDLGKQIAVDESDPDEDRQFCFFNTIDSQFLKFDGESVWTSWKDFDAAWKAHWGTVLPQQLRSLTREYERLKSLCPTWVFRAG